MSHTQDELDLGDQVAPALAVQAVSIDDQTVVFDPLRNAFYRLNSTGSFVWRLLDAQPSVGAIAAKLARAYDCTEYTAREETTRFLTEMLSIGLVVTNRDTTTNATVDERMRD